MCSISCVKMEEFIHFFRFCCEKIPNHILRTVQREIKKHEESLWQEDDKDLDTLLSTRRSFNCYKKQRNQLFHSSPSKARPNRTAKKGHAKSHTEIVFQKREMLECVNALDPVKKFKMQKQDARVNWSICCNIQDS